MRKNVWRLTWVLLSRGALVALFLTSAHLAREREATLQGLLSRTFTRTAPPTSDFFDPWAYAAVAVLLAGVVAEIRMSPVSPILNSGPVVACLAWTLWDVAGALRQGSYEGVAVGLAFVIIPLALVIAIDVPFYIHAFRGKVP